MATAAMARPDRGVRLATGIAGAVFAGLTAFVVTARSSPPTTYGAVSALARTMGLAAGIGLLAAAAATAIVRPRASVAVATALLGVTWLADDWVGWERGPAVARSLAMVAVPFLVPLVTHLTLAYPSGRRRGTSAVVLAGAYGAAALTSLGYAVFRDPFLELGCWSNCSDNSLLVHADPQVVRLLNGFWMATVIVAALVTMAAAAFRLARATGVARRSMFLVLVASATVALGNAIHAWLVNQRTEDPTAPSFRAVYLLRAAALLAVVAGVVWGLWRVERTRRAVMRLADDLGTTPAPGSLGHALARSFGDSGLTVAYWLPSSQRYVDAAGHQVQPRPRAGQATTAIVRNGEPVALVIHDDALAPQGAIGAASRLAVDNERLRAEVLARLADLRASRARIVAAADGTRRRLERDLHDGAQQRLLAASFELRQACASAPADGDTGLAVALAAASEEVQQALTEVRDLAHGIYPAILTEAGLEPAVRSLAAHAPLPVEVGDVVAARFSAVVESTAYTVASEAIQAAAKRSATYLSVSIAEERDRLAVHIGADGAGPSPQLLVDLGDRVGALGGTIALVDGMLHAEIPCAS